MILAIDPGPEKSAFVVWDGVKCRSFGIQSNSEVLGYISDVAREVDQCLLAIEKIASYGMAVGAEVFETCVATGRFMQQWCHYRDDRDDSGITRIPRLDIKVHLCKSAKAKDANVRAALIDRFGAPGTKKAPGPLYGITSHCWAALAVAVVAHDRLSIGAPE